MAWRLRLVRDRPNLTLGPVGRQEQPPPLAARETLPNDTLNAEDMNRSSTRSEDEDSETEDTDSSTVGTSAKRRLRKRHKLRFRQSREEVYAQQYVYKVLAESGIYPGHEGEQNHRQFVEVELTLLILKAIRKLDIEYKEAILEDLKGGKDVHFDWSR